MLTALLRTRPQTSLAHNVFAASAGIGGKAGPAPAVRLVPPRTKIGSDSTGRRAHASGRPTDAGGSATAIP